MINTTIIPFIAYMYIQHSNLVKHTHSFEIKHHTKIYLFKHSYIISIKKKLKKHHKLSPTLPT